MCSELAPRVCVMLVQVGVAHSMSEAAWKKTGIVEQSNYDGESRMLCKRYTWCPCK